VRVNSLSFSGFDKIILLHSRHTKPLIFHPSRPYLLNINNTIVDYRNIKQLIIIIIKVFHKFAELYIILKVMA
jgi:hypothetical protein